MRRPLVVLFASILSCSPAMPLAEDAGAQVDGGIRIVQSTDAGTCPAELPFYPAWHDLDRQRERRVGTDVTFEFSVEARSLNSACARITVVDPAGVATVVDDTFTTTIFLGTPGRYVATLSLKSNALKQRSMDFVALAEPPNNAPCASFTRECRRVGRSGDALACDDELLDMTGRRLAILDGGEWFAAADALFSWHDGALNVWALDGGAPAALGSTPWHQKPLRWSGDRQQLAVWNEDGGVRLSVANGLSKLGDISSDVPVEALAVQSDGGMLRVSSSGTRLACPLEGTCAQLENLTALRAANATTVWASAVEDVHYTRVFRFQQVDAGAWAAAIVLPFQDVAAHQLNRRPLQHSAWGARLLEQQSGDFRFDGATSGGTSDELVWLTDGAKTLVWCE